MSLKKIKAVIDKFLTSDDPEVICISGEWGIGKTHLWNERLEDAVNSNEKRHGVAVNRYSYVTLFGLNSLDDVKGSIFENTVSGKNLTKRSDEVSFIERIKELPKVGRSSVFRDVAGLITLGKHSQSAILSAAFLTIRNQIVCFDDIERAGDSLNPKDILGLASYLKEQRNCKVIILLNQDEISEQYKEVFDATLEKVADISLVYKSSAAEAVKIAFGPGDSDVAQIMTPYVMKLEISNIRVLRRLVKFGQEIWEHISDLNKSVVEQALATLVLSGWSIHQPRIAIPIEFIEKCNTIVLHMMDRDKKLSDVEKSHQAILEKYGFVSLDDVDRVIIRSVKNGYIDEPDLIEKARRKDILFREHGGDLSNVWSKMYRGSLTVDDADFAEKLYEVTLRDLEHLSFGSVDASIRIVRLVLGDDKANFLVNSYVEICESRGIEHLEPLRGGMINPDDVDADFLEEFRNRIDEYIDDRNPFDVLVKIADDNHWSEYDVRLFSKISVDEFVALLESLEGEQVMRSVSTLSRLASSQDRKNPKLKENIETAFEVISTKSPLRRRKIEQFRK